VFPYNPFLSSDCRPLPFRPYSAACTCALLFALCSASWAQAPLNPDVPKLRLAPELTAPKPSDQPGVVFFSANQIDGDAKEGVVTARGSVMFRSRQQTLRAQWARYTEADDKLEAKGDIVWRSLTDTVKTDVLDYSPTTQRGTAGKTQFTLGLYGGTGTSEALEMRGPGKLGLKTGTYTTCKTETPAWCLFVEQMDIDQGRDVGTAKGAKVTFFGVPVFWWPAFDFPLGKERKSGFLAPTYGSTQVRGFELQLPYYLNLAPNYDATITPRLMTRRGVQINTEFRYLFDDVLGHSSGTLIGEILPKDRVAGATRSRVHWRHEQAFSLPGLRLGVDAQRVSDDLYFADLSTSVTATAISTIPRFVTLSYAWNDWLFAARLQRFQSLQDPTSFVAFTPPYEKVPELSASRTWRDFYGFEAKLDASVTQFEHPFLATGIRSLAVAQLSRPWRAPGYFVVPKIAVNAADYRLDTKDLDFRDTTRVIPYASLDAGLVFERDTAVFGRNYLQTLEPRVFYTYIPFKRQNQVPNFDSAPIDFNYAQLFQENRYSGNDRIGDANEATIAITSRFLESDGGRERLRVSIGERFYFRDQRINVGETVRERSTSDLLGVVSFHPNERFSVEGTLQFNTNTSRTERSNFLARYSPEPRKVVSGSFRYIRELVDAGNISEIRQIDLAGQWPLRDIIGKRGESWYGVGRVNYSFPERKVVEAIAGLEYDGDCWVGRLVAQRIATGVQKATNSIFWQIELNGLSRIGTNPLDVLKRNIPGYQSLTTLEAGRRRNVTLSDVFQPLD
jgi:LPS-assembly protein